jgi:hypothetical protein
LKRLSPAAASRTLSVASAMVWPSSGSLTSRPSVPFQSLPRPSSIADISSRAFATGSSIRSRPSRVLCSAETRPDLTSCIRVRAELTAPSIRSSVRSTSGPPVATASLARSVASSTRDTKRSAVAIGASMLPSATQVSAPRIRSANGPATHARPAIAVSWTVSSALSIRGSARSIARSIASVEPPSMTWVSGSPGRSSRSAPLPDAGSPPSGMIST